MLTIREDLFKEFAFWGTILIMKTMFMSLLTAGQRVVKKVVANPEDVIMSTMKVDIDEDVERVRRAHQNDLENVLPWFLMTLVWLTTGPSHIIACWLIRIFVVARILHSIVYAMLAKQPWRGLLFFIGFGITAYEAVMTLIHYCY